MVRKGCRGVRQRHGRRRSTYGRRRRYAFAGVEMFNVLNVWPSTGDIVASYDMSIDSTLPCALADTPPLTLEVEVAAGSEESGGESDMKRLTIRLILAVSIA